MSPAAPSPAGFPGSVHAPSRRVVVPKFFAARLFAAVMAVAFATRGQRVAGRQRRGVGRVLRLSTGVPGQPELDDDRRQPDEDDRHQEDGDDGGRARVAPHATADHGAPEAVHQAQFAPGRVGVRRVVRPGLAAVPFSIDITVLDWMTPFAGRGTNFVKLVALTATQTTTRSPLVHVVVRAGRVGFG